MRRQKFVSMSVWQNLKRSEPKTPATATALISESFAKCATCHNLRSTSTKSDMFCVRHYPSTNAKSTASNRLCNCVSRVFSAITDPQPKIRKENATRSCPYYPAWCRTCSVRGNQAPSACSHELEQMSGPRLTKRQEDSKISAHDKNWTCKLVSGRITARPKSKAGILLKESPVKRVVYSANLSQPDDAFVSMNNLMNRLDSISDKTLPYVLKETTQRKGILSSVKETCFSKPPGLDMKKRVTFEDQICDVLPNSSILKPLQPSVTVRTLSNGILQQRKQKSSHLSSHEPLTLKRNLEFHNNTFNKSPTESSA